MGDQINQIKDYTMTIEDVNVALNIWGKNIAALKVNTTGSKQDTVARDSMKFLWTYLNYTRK